nr:ATP-binding protein [bacterium]
GKDIDRIEAASLRAREIIKNLLLFARQKTPVRRKANLNDIVSEGMCFFEARCERSGVEITRELEEGLPDVVADADQLNQALVNLVVNALQAMPSGGRLTLRTKSGDGSAALCVEDTGCGMSEEVVKKLFIPFFTTKDIGQGTGLGLPVAHGIVAAHGGWIRVDSEVGKGSAFEIRLPVSRENSEEKK